MLGPSIAFSNRPELIESSYRRRSGEGIYQEDYVAVEQMDGRGEDLQARRGDHEQRDWGTCGKMAV